ncbi:MAG: hypothetical protein QOJ99_261 [Bryobacterales bacterium]|nr:hypothetical protein [Bryobacterales bacterium]
MVFPSLVASSRNAWFSPRRVYIRVEVGVREPRNCRAEFFNIFNHPALAPPVTDVTNPQFGQIISGIGGSEQNVQFGLRFLF